MTGSVTAMSEDASGDRVWRPDRDSPTEVSVQLADYLREEILAGRLRGKLPANENDMARMHGIAPLTWRRAVARLAGEGLLTVRKRRGTWVVPPESRPQQPL